MGREFELKYRATPPLQAALRQAYPGNWQTVAMETTYYDTPAGDLGRIRWTLRRRLENGVAVCTVKTPCPDGGRGEWEVNRADIREAIPELCAMGAPKQLLLCLGGELQAVCGARFTRQALTVEQEGCTVEIALDSGVLLGSGREQPLCEIEVELKSGSDAAAVAFAQKLAKDLGLTPETRSKYRRALALARGE